MVTLRNQRLVLSGLWLCAVSCLCDLSPAWAAVERPPWALAGVSAKGVRPSRVASAHRFPKAFRGRWAHVAADCHAMGVSAIRAGAILTIRSDGLEQGSWRPTTVEIVQTFTSPQQVLVRAHDEADDQAWGAQVFTLLEEGRVLQWRRNDAESAPPALLYRCG